MITLRIDLETFSSVDLRKCGVHKYVESPDFQVMLFGFKFSDGPARVIDLAAGEKIPLHILSALDDPTIQKTAYNAAFELACLTKHFRRQLDVTQWRCTSVHALYLGLPGNLADVGRVVGLAPEKQKMSIGWSLIRYFCIPCKPTKKNGERTRNLAQHDPAKWQLFKDYCGQDVEAEHAIAERIAKFPVPEIEWKLWHLDQRMMNTGVKVDRELVNAAIECDAIFKDRLMAEAVRLTGLENPNSRNQLLAWLQEAEDDDTIVDEAGKRGSTVHNLTEALDKGDRVTMCAPDGSPLYKMSEWAMFERYVEFRNLIKPEIIAIERHMASKELGYAGTLDRVMRIGEDVWIIDLKTSNAVYEHHHLQTAAYLELYAEAEKMDAFAYTKVRRGILHLNAKTRSYGKGEAIQGPGWQLVEASNTHEEDLDLFEACRKLWHATNKNAKPKSISYQLTHKI